MTFPDKYDRGKATLEIGYTSADGQEKSVSINGMQLSESSIENVKVYVGRIATISAKDLGRKVTAKITENGEVISNIQEYSVESYSKNRLEKSDNGDFKALLISLMKYGKAAEAYLVQ